MAAEVNRGELHAHIGTGALFHMQTKKGYNH